MTTLEQMREQMRETKPISSKAEKWRAPVFLGSGTKVLAFDQTLRNTGYVLLVDELEGPVIKLSGMIQPEGDSRGSFIDTYARGLHLFESVRELLGSIVDLVDEVVIEMPPVGRAFRSESSLIAGQMIFAAVKKSWSVEPILVSNLSMKSKLLSPKERSTKPTKSDVKRAVESYVERPSGRWNEHVVDATALGLTRLIKERSWG